MDEYTSIANERFMSIILNYQEGRHNLGVAVFNRSSTSEALKQTLTTHLERIDVFLIDHIVAVVSDVAVVMNKLKHSIPTIEQLCLSHGIHLAVSGTFASKKQEFHSNYEDVDPDVRLSLATTLPLLQWERS